MHFQYGRLKAPSFAGGGKDGTGIVTLQHASEWEYGDNFFFVDFLASGNRRFNNRDAYLEWYPTLSLGKISGSKLAFGPIRDIALIGGVNVAVDDNVTRALPGIRFALDLPGFAFANLDVMAVFDESAGVRSGGAPSQDDTYMVDFNWGLPFSIGDHDFSLVGHAEYGGSTTNEFNDRVEWHILAQPQLRWDMGKALWEMPNKFFAGIEYQLWINKLGDKSTDESAVQALFVWRF